MKIDQYQRLGQLWNSIGLPVYEDLITAIGGMKIRLDTIGEAMVYYGAFKRLPIKDQIMAHSTVTVEKNIVMVNLLTEFLKVSNEAGEAAVREAKGIINQKNIQ